jgi:hypothetical protein
MKPTIFVGMVAHGFLSMLVVDKQIREKQEII